jgi:hypothetical protein
MGPDIGSHKQALNSPQGECVISMCSAEQCDRAEIPGPELYHTSLSAQGHHRVRLDHTQGIPCPGREARAPQGARMINLRSGIGKTAAEARGTSDSPDRGPELRVSRQFTKQPRFQPRLGEVK